MPDHTHIMLDHPLSQDACQELQIAWNKSLGEVCQKHRIPSKDLIPFAQVNLLMMLRVMAIAAVKYGVEFEKTRLVYVNSLLRMPENESATTE